MRRAALLVAALLVVGCGEKEEPTAPAATPAATATGDPLAPAPGETPDAPTTTELVMGEGGALTFSQTSLRIDAGRTLTLSARNVGETDHALALRGKGVDVEGNVAGPGQTSTLELAVEPGKYVFYCPISKHEQAGMKGTLVVR